jgi:hypothetical protein
MKKIYKILIFLTILIYPFSATPHVKHYENLSKIEFDIYRNGKHIGKHVFSFKKIENKIIVDSEINFVIKKLGLVLYKYNVKGSEIYENGNLVEFKSKTNQNGKEKYVNLKLNNDMFLIDGSSNKGSVPTDLFLGTWWNHSIVKSKAQISAVSGRVIKHKVTFLGKETIKFNEKKINTLRFNFSSTDNKLNNDKKLNTDVWYDEESLNWVKASFEKKGKWEYKLKQLLVND